MSKDNIVVKVGMLGDVQVGNKIFKLGKTSLMVRYIDGKFNEDYIQTLGINFLEKKIEQKNTDITYMIWDVGIIKN
jgi:GTP-binding protein of the ras superfamily involved in termination of M-phase